MKNLANYRVIEVTVYEKRNSKHMWLKLKKLLNDNPPKIKQLYRNGRVLADGCVDVNGFEVTRWIELKPKKG